MWVVVPASAYSRGLCTKQWPWAWMELGITRDMTFLEFFPILLTVELRGEESRIKLTVLGLTTTQWSKDHRSLCVYLTVYEAAANFF